MVNMAFTNKLIKKYEEAKSQGFKFDNIIIKESNMSHAGLGVFADKDFKKNELINFAPGFMYNQSDLNPQKEHPFVKYSYTINCDCKNCKKNGLNSILHFGAGSLFNTAFSQKTSNVDIITVLYLEASFLSLTNYIYNI